MVGMVGVSTCTPTFSNVCLGSESRLMDLDDLCLADYYASPDATYPAVFGGRVPHPSQVMTTGELAESVPEEPPVTSKSPKINESSNYHDISQSCYDMLEKYVLYISLFMLIFFSDLALGLSLLLSTLFVMCWGM